MTAAAAIAWTREPLPSGVVTVGLGPTCRTCRATDLSYGPEGLRPPFTRSAEPLAVDGQYVVQPHHRWCPVWTGVVADPACPACGALVQDYEFAPGFSAAVPHPIFGTAHVVGTADEVLDHPSAAGSRLERVQSLDKVTLFPCGDTVKGDDARRVITRITQLRAERLRAEADAVLAGAAQLLTVAETAGNWALADAYRDAVRRRSPDAGGLLAALHILHPHPETGEDRS